MAVEQRRGCGYRKVGGTYLVSSGIGGPCCKFPIKLSVCPTCNMGIKQARSYMWIDPRPWLSSKCAANIVCPASDPSKLGDKVLLMWVGTKFYPTVDSFVEEANRLGVSKRISALPRDFVIGKTWVFLAHPKAIRLDDGSFAPGVFQIFKPHAVERIITESQSHDPKLMRGLKKQNLKPVIVPDDDPDHQTISPRASTLQSQTTTLKLFH
jgi:hypothetical protein